MALKTSRVEKNKIERDNQRLEKKLDTILVLMEKQSSMQVILPHNNTNNTNTPSAATTVLTTHNTDVRYNTAEVYENDEVDKNVLPDSLEISKQLDKKTGSKKRGRKPANKVGKVEKRKRREGYLRNTQLKKETQNEIEEEEKKKMEDRNYSNDCSPELHFHNRYNHLDEHNVNDSTYSTLVQNADNSSELEHELNRELLKWEGRAQKPSTKRNLATTTIATSATTRAVPKTSPRAVTATALLSVCDKRENKKNDEKKSEEESLSDPLEQNGIEKEPRKKLLLYDYSSPSSPSSSSNESDDQNVNGRSVFSSLLSVPRKRNKESNTSVKVKIEEY